MRAANFFRRRPQGWLLPAGLALGAATILAASPKWQSADRRPGPAQRAENSASARADKAKPGLRTPVPGPHKELAAVFGKAAPTSIAELRTMEQHVKTLAARVSPSVVSVEVGYGSGSGVIISADGLVLTAGHVCGRPNRDVRFTFADGRTAKGKTLGLDEESDAGLMQITDPGPWPSVSLGEPERGNIGGWVLALGHPGGFDAKRSLVVRLGRIIGLRRGDALQTDCTISPGDSGGPLFDMHGRVIGIHSYISGSMADNFHVPIASFYDNWENMVKGERTRE